jgi:hypothetical protein
MIDIDWASIGEPDQKAPTSDRAPLTPGTYYGVIDTVVEQKGWRVDARNPTGDCISIWIDFEEDGQKKRVFATVACNWTAKLLEIADCAGVPGPKRGEASWDEQTLVGATVYCETSTYIAQKGKDAGREKASIAKWIPRDRQPQAEAAAPASSEKPAARKRKAAPHDEPLDDIPF